jgi:pyrimidine deaminase RibD-like protein
MKRAVSVLIALAFFAAIALTQAKAPGMTGYVTDAMCAKSGDLSNAECAKKCAKQGVALVFVSDQDKKIMSVDNQDALKGHEGQHVMVSGKVDNGALHVDTINPVQ